MTPSEFVREHTPFRMWIGTLYEFEQCKNKHFARYSDNIAAKIETFWPGYYDSKEALKQGEEYDIAPENIQLWKDGKTEVWICVLFVGRGLPFLDRSRFDTQGGERSFSVMHDDGWTYWFMESKEKPTQDEAIHALFQFVMDYDCDDSRDLPTHLKKMREEWEMDMNTVDFEREKLLLEYAFEMLYGIMAEFFANQMYCTTSTFGGMGPSSTSRSTEGSKRLLRDYAEYVEY